MKNKNGQPAEIPQTKRKLGSTGVIDRARARVVSCQYDTRGRLVSTSDSTSTGIGTLNPFRYREYCYDVETGLYYLKSRFYDPETGRFVSADDVDVLDVEQDSLQQYNLYLYCLDNPVNRGVKEGDISIAIGISGAVAIKVLGYAICFTAIILGIRMIQKEAPYITAKISSAVAIGAVQAYSTMKSIVKPKGATVSMGWHLPNNLIRNMSKGGKQRVIDTGLVGIPIEELLRRHGDSKTPADEKKRIERHLKGESVRNKQKRQNNKKNSGKKKKKEKTTSWSVKAHDNRYY